MKKGVSFLVEKNRVDRDDKVLRSRWLEDSGTGFDLMPLFPITLNKSK